ncbi:MAG TPA: dNTP triphosphohydrolase [Tepidisphaeraceae bacterium]|nr:dNTP triphosphohydrolase [Tepidisphaeraceae bacterium]
MEWTKLLSPRRIRELMGGKPSGVNDHRTPFQSDFDRLVFSSPVKRLQDKAQVFPLDRNDAVRTRLTHSLEVSCVARGLGQRVARALVQRGNIDEEQARAIEDICGTAGLIHDLGNPPFGHYGETAISKWFEAGVGQNALGPIAHVPQLHSDFTNFEGNARTLRLLCHLQVLSDQHGMNPTAALMGATMKYMVPSHEPDRTSKDHGRTKPGFLFAEREMIAVVRKELGVDNARHPLVYLVEAADDCVYSICDVEDGVRKGILSFDAAVAGLVEKAKANSLDHNAISSIAANTKGAIDKGVESGPKLSDHAREDSYMQMFRVMVIGKTVEGSANAFLKRYDDIMAGTYKDELVADNEAGVAKSLVKACKKLGVAKIYNTRPTIELELRGGKIIQSLLDMLWLGIDPKTKEEDHGKRCHSLISHSYRHLHDFELEHAKANAYYGYSAEQIERYYGLLLLTDYVGGMTDSFASNLYGSLNHG